MTDTALDLRFADAEDHATEIQGVDDRHAATPRRRTCALITFGDSASAARLAWIEAVFGAVRPIRYAQGAMEQQAHALGAFEFLVISGKDVPRIRQITRELAALVANRPSICVASNLPAPRYGALRGMGFDDVFDIRKISPARAQDRLSHVAQWYLENTRQLAVESAAVDQLCATGRLTKTEMAVFRLFIRAPDYLVDNDTLRQMAGASGQPADMTYVRVLISGIRKKLRDGVVITNLYDKGYVLKFSGSGVLKFSDAAA
jgi:hypothetical protein